MWIACAFCRRDLILQYDPFIIFKDRKIVLCLAFKMENGIRTPQMCTHDDWILQSVQAVSKSSFTE